MVYDWGLVCFLKTSRKTESKLPSTPDIISSCGHCPAIVGHNVRIDARRLLINIRNIWTSTTNYAFVVYALTILVHWANCNYLVRFEMNIHFVCIFLHIHRYKLHHEIERFDSAWSIWNRYSSCSRQESFL